MGGGGGGGDCRILILAALTWHALRTWSPRTAVFVLFLESSGCCLVKGFFHKKLNLTIIL